MKKIFIIIPAVLFASALCVFCAAQGSVNNNNELGAPADGETQYAAGETGSGVTSADGSAMTDPVTGTVADPVTDQATGTAGKTTDAPSETTGDMTTGDMTTGVCVTDGVSTGKCVLAAVASAVAAAVLTGVTMRLLSKKRAA